jgi:hypothetical protein
MLFSLFRSSLDFLLFTIKHFFLLFSLSGVKFFLSLFTSCFLSFFFLPSVLIFFLSTVCSFLSFFLTPFLFHPFFHLCFLSLHLSLFITSLAGPPGAARDYFTISLWKSPVQIDLRTLRAMGWGEPPTNNIFIFKPTPRSNFCLLAPAQFSKQTPPFGRVDPAGPRLGWAPHK